MVEFLNGHSFFVAKLHEHYGATAVALHATYQFGDSPEYSYGKRERLRRAGLWAVDDHEYYTPPKLLVIKGDLLQGFSMPADYDETVRLQGRKTSTPQGEGCGRSAHRLTAGVGAFRWMVASTSTWLPTRCSGGGCWTHSPSPSLWAARWWCRSCGASATAIGGCWYAVRHLEPGSCTP